MLYHILSRLVDVEWDSLLSSKIKSTWGYQKNIIVPHTWEYKAIKIILPLRCLFLDTQPMKTTHINSLHQFRETLNSCLILGEIEGDDFMDTAFIIFFYLLKYTRSGLRTDKKGRRRGRMIAGWGFEFYHSRFMPCLKIVLWSDERLSDILPDCWYEVPKRLPRHT